MKPILKILLFFILAMSCSDLFAQAERDTSYTAKKVVITMNNGEEFRGEIIRIDSSSIVLKTVNGELNLMASNVKSIVMDHNEGRFSFANPHDTRYFFGPTGIPIKKGKGYYQNVLVTTNFVNYGITKNISIGGGFEFISTVFGQPIWFLTPKVGFEIYENMHVGAGFIMAGFAAEGAATLGYGVFTLGNADNNVSIGSGYGLFDGRLSKYPAIMASGTTRLFNNVALMSENYVIPGENNAVYFGIQGIRLLSSKNSFDLGAIISPQILDFIPAFPYAAYVRVF